jgi:nicotinate-nucleotide adenylyltransferase
MRAILGGTFDPPHVAHLVAGEVAHEQLRLDTVTFLPAGRPWQKEGHSVSSAHHRLRMVELATLGTEHFAVDDREVHRDGWTYTIDTVESFGEQDVVLILGADSARNLPTWHRSADLLDQVTVAIVPRPGIDRAEVEQAIDAHVVWLDMPALDVSGTMLRQRVASGKSIRFLVPQAVLDYIDENGLYRNSP